MDIITATGLWDGIGAFPNSAVIERVRLYKLKTQAPRPGRDKCRRRLWHPATSKPAALKPKAAAPTSFVLLRACHSPVGEMMWLRFLKFIRTRRSQMLR